MKLPILSFVKRIFVQVRSTRTLWIFLIILALLVGLFESLDHWIVLVHSPEVYGGYVTPPVDTHRHVLFPQMRDIIDGHWLIADTQLYEYRDGPPLTPWPWLPPLLYAGFWKIFGPALWLPMSSLIIGALSFLILQQIITEITGRRVLGVLFALLTFASRLWAVNLFPTSWEEIRVLITQFIPNAFSVSVGRGDFLPYEAFNPTFLILGPALLLFHRAIVRMRPRLFLVVGVLCGLLVYCYPFHWIFMSAALGSASLLYVGWKRWRLALAVLGGVGLNILVTVPFWLNQLALQRSGILHDINLRNAGFELGYYFRTSQWEWYVLWLMLSVVLVWIGKKKKETGTVFFLVLLFLALFFSLNMQVVIGRNIHADHWMSKVHILPLAWTVSYLVSYVIHFASQRRWVRPLFAYICIAVLVAGALLGAVQEKIRIAHNLITRPPITRDVWSALQFMSEHLPVDSVVLIPSVDVSAYQTIYTSTRSYLSHGLSTFASEDEVLARFFAACHFFGISDSYISSVLQKKPVAQSRGDLIIGESDNYLERQLFWLKFRSQEFDGSLQGYTKSSEVPDAVIESIIQKYRQFSGDVISLRTKYRLDYVLSTDFDQAVGTVDLSTNPYLEEVFRSGNVRLYRLRDVPLVSPVTIR